MHGRLVSLSNESDSIVDNELVILLVERVSGLMFKTYSKYLRGSNSLQGNKFHFLDCLSLSLNK